MTISRAGSNQKYAEGWERAFGNKSRSTKAKPSASKSKAATKKVAKSQKSKSVKKSRSAKKKK